MSVSDTQRSKVYAAEEFVRTLFDRAGEHGNQVVDFFGAQLTLPPEGRFASTDAVQRYVDDVLDMAAVRERWPGRGPLAVRARRGVTAAHYERADDGAGGRRARRAHPLGAARTGGAARDRPPPL